MVQRQGNSTPEDGRYWVAQPTVNKVLMDHNGALLDLPNEVVTLRVIRSGYRNQQAAPIATVSSRNNPFANGNTLLWDSGSEAIEATAMTFSDQWKMRCNEVDLGAGSSAVIAEDTINPYAQGLAGNWRPSSEFIFYGDRTPDALPSAPALATSIRQTGFLDNFAAFWQYNAGSWNINSSDSRWTAANTVTMYDQRGNEVENRDALGVSSSASFGYNQNRVKAIASNALFSEMAFDGFEDYRYDNDCVDESAFRKAKFFDTNRESPQKYELIEGIAHTGKFSLMLGVSNQTNIILDDSCQVMEEPPPGENQPPVAILGADKLCAAIGPPGINFFGTFSSDPESGPLNYFWYQDGSLQPAFNGQSTIQMIFFSGFGNHTVDMVVEDNGGLRDTASLVVEIWPDESFCPQQFSKGPTSPGTVGFNGVSTSAAAAVSCNEFEAIPGANVYINNCCGCLPTLSLQSSQTYLFSLWVSTENSLDCGAAPVAPDLKVILEPSGTEISIVPSGPVIEGWQRFEGVVGIPTGNARTILQLTNANQPYKMYFDDLRIHPFLANMKSYVYDPSTLRLWATLDENNYASFYEYNDEGILVRTKRETERGIMTVQESRTVLRPNDREDYVDIQVSIKIRLAGPANNGSMDAHLADGNLLPGSEPYTALGKTHVKGGGNETAYKGVFSQTGDDAIIDWLMVELRDKNDRSRVLYTRSALLQKDGDVVDMDGTSPLTFSRLEDTDYFIAVKHRNHLAVMTESALQIID